MNGLVDLRTGLVSRAVFSDDAIYWRELERIYARCWLFLAHDSQLPNPGDYVTTTMGEDSVIVCRDPRGRVRAFLNTCRHRGNKVCQFERGNAVTFTCGYHGWSYNTEGKLSGVPFFEEAYYGDLDRDAWALAEVPRLESFGGLLFGCWDEQAPPLRAYLGEMAWYLERLLLVAEDLGGLEVAAASRYVANGNWKIPSENFAGDHYHTPTTHGSSFALRIRGSEGAFGGAQDPHGPFEVALEPGHGLGGIHTGAEPYEHDLARAERMGPDVMDFIKARYAALQRRLGDTPARPYCFSHGTVFPNFALGGGGSAMRGNAFYLFQPKGPLKTEVAQWIVVPRAMPQAVRDVVVQQFGSEGHFASGFFEQDDSENFERVTEATRTPIARRYPFFYGMALRQEGRWPGQEQWDVAGLPGVVGPRFSEHNQRKFYGYWAKLMADGAD
ncbi:MAG TPA: Rieske 2Fe-2S domain-containing protein [Chloroflexota bacterium]